MPQGNPESFPRGNSNVASTLKNSETTLSGSGFIISGDGSLMDLSSKQDMTDVNTLLHNQTIKVNVNQINDLNLILNDNDCGNAFFHEIIEALESKGLKITTSKQNDDLMYENATVITLDQQMIAGEGVAFIGPCKAGTANNSEALLKSMQMTFQQQGWSTDSFAGVMKYLPNNSDEVYRAVPSDTENSVLPDSTYITISFGTMSPGFDASKVADDITLSLARYQHYLANDSKDVTIASNPDVVKQANDNHYWFNDQIEGAPSFSPNLSFEVSREIHYSK